MVSVIHKESAWNSRATSPTNDRGLGQIHISDTTNPELKGKEHTLYNPTFNIHMTASMLRMWKNWHDRSCSLSKKKHPYWAHYAWGYKIQNLDGSIKIYRIFKTLEKRFKPSLPLLATQHQHQGELIVREITSRLAETMHALFPPLNMYASRLWTR
jgi:hypothetical protein